MDCIRWARFERLWLKFSVFVCQIKLQKKSKKRGKNILIDKFWVDFIEICQFTLLYFQSNRLLCFFTKYKRRWALNGFFKIVCHWEGLVIFGWFFGVFSFVCNVNVMEYNWNGVSICWDGEYIFGFSISTWRKCCNL